MADPLSNLFYSELTGLPYGTGDTSFTLTAGSVADLPDADTEGAYNLVIWDRQHGSPAIAKREGGVYEIVRVTADDSGTDTITVSRAQEGTIAQSYASGNVYGVIQSATKRLWDTLIFVNSSNQLVDTDGNVLSSSKRGLSGVTIDDMWRLTTSFIASTGINDISSNLERIDTNSFEVLGGGMTQSSGVFTFPETGYYDVIAHFTFTQDGGNDDIYGTIHTTPDNTNYNISSLGRTHISQAGTGDAWASSIAIASLKVTDIANQKVRFKVNSSNSSSSVFGSSNISYTYFKFVKKGDI